MGFQNVDDEKSDPAAVLLVKLVESGNLPAERRSSVAAKYKNQRLLGRERREPDGFTLVQLQQREIRGNIAGVQLAGAGAGPHGFKRKHQEGGIGHVGHDASEDCWWLAASGA